MAILKPHVEMYDVQPQVLGSSACDMEHAPGDDDGDDDDDTEESRTWEERRWSLLLSSVCCVDLFASGIMLSVSLNYAYRDNGVSLYCLGIQSSAHWISSMLLLLRFLAELVVMQTAHPDMAKGLLQDTRRRNLLREQVFNVTMGLVLLISSVALLFKAIRKFKYWNSWFNDHVDMDAEVAWATAFLSWYGVVFYGGQAILRVFIGKKLARTVISHSVMASVVSLLFFFVLAVAASYEKEWSWKAEPIAAMALACVTLSEGIRLTITHIEDVDHRMQRDPRA